MRYVIWIVQTALILAKIFEVGAVAAWSWWWVMSPLWIGVPAFASIATVFIVGASLIGTATKKTSRSRLRF